LIERNRNALSASDRCPPEKWMLLCSKHSKSMWKPFLCSILCAFSGWPLLQLQLTLATGASPSQCIGLATICSSRVGLPT
jgi:hypothetical protein